MAISRPRFLTAAGAAAAAAGLPTTAFAQDAPIPRRQLGRTGVMVSLVALGGAHIGQATLSDADAIALIHAAIDRGITFMDTSWDYSDGRSEMRMGRALAQGGYRDRAFLMTKVDGRDAKTATRQLDESLRRLRTNHVDLWQFHENIRPDDADRIFAPGGGIEAALAALRAGKVRFIGFTGHKDPRYHVHMFDVAAQHKFIFDTVQMPINVMDAHFRSFQTTVIPVAQITNTAILAMKTFGDHFILDAGLVDPVTMLHYSMNQPVSTVVTGIDSPHVLAQAVTAATTFRPLSRDEVEAILAKTASAASNGSTELYKTSDRFDATMHHPEYLG
jgi:aryl-alcohol dehydrogenase-like predicted oxidoreductase